MGTEYDYTCPNCAKECSVDESLVGQKIICAFCSKEFLATPPAQPLPPEPAPASSEPQPDLTLVTCPCQNCNGHIQFDAVTLSQDNNKTACPHCGLETILFVPPTNDAKMQKVLSPASPPPPPAPAKRRNHWAFVLLVGFILFLGYKYYHGIQQYNRVVDSMGDPRSKEESGPRAARLRTDAPEVLRKACLEAVTGFTRIIEPALSDYDENPYNWTAAPTCEFINRLGGVERTNLLFVFAVHDGELYCYPDIAKMSDRDFAKWKADMDRLGGN
jgi:hypothetical protein